MVSFQVEVDATVDAGQVIKTSMQILDSRILFQESRQYFVDFRVHFGWNLRNKINKSILLCEYV